jgi:transposase
MRTQMQELVARAGKVLTEPWNKPVGRPKSLGLYGAVEVACMYLRQNGTQEFIGDLRDVSQATVSRIVTVLVPIIKAVLEEFVPDARDAIQVVKGRVVLVDGAITPCWSYADHRELWSRKHGTTGFNAQLVSLLDGQAVYISEPLDGRTHDATAFTETDVAEIVRHSGGGIADKGYQGCDGLATPRKKPKGGELGKRDKECNAEISALRAPVERLVAHFKNWRIFHTDYRRPYRTYRDAYDAGRGLFFFSISKGFE